MSQGNGTVWVSDSFPAWVSATHNRPLSQRRGRFAAPRFNFRSSCRVLFRRTAHFGGEADPGTKKDRKRAEGTSNDLPQSDPSLKPGPSPGRIDRGLDLSGFSNETHDRQVPSSQLHTKSQEAPVGVELYTDRNETVNEIFWMTVSQSGHSLFD